MNGPQTHGGSVASRRRVRFTHPTRSVSAAADGLAGFEVAGFAGEGKAVGAAGDFDELLGVGVVSAGRVTTKR